MNSSTEHPDQLLESDSDKPEELRRRLDSMAQLLHRAAKTVWSRADEEGPASPLHSLGLGIYLAHGEAQLLLAASDLLVAADPNLELDSDLAVAAVDDRTVVQLLAEVQELGQPLPLWRADLLLCSPLVVDLCDLIREAEHLGC